jgi:hypothetical protein
MYHASEPRGKPSIRPHSQASGRNPIDSAAISGTLCSRRIPNPSGNWYATNRIANTATRRDGECALRRGISLNKDRMLV